MIGCRVAFAQFADPSVTGASFSPNQISVGQTSLLTISFANTGFTVIPANSIELTISTAFSYYTPIDNMAPTGTGALLFDWIHIGSMGQLDFWRGTNNVEVVAFGGGDILLTVIGNNISTDDETTNINVQPVNNFDKFFDSPDNNNLQLDLKINQSIVVCKVICLPFSVIKM